MIEHYETEGPHYILAWGSSGPSIVVARSTMRGRRWLRCVRKIGAPGWHVSAHKTRRAALVY